MTASEDYLIQLNDVSFAYPESGPVIQNINTTVRRGEFLALIGPNGSGKSTLAGLIAGLLLPNAGRVRVDGMDTADQSLQGAIRRRVGMVLQNPDNQLVAARVEEDVAFGPENLNLPSPEVCRRVESALAAVGLELLRGHPPHLLSGGEKQRLAIAGLLALEPSCLVLDEPTSMLDPRSRRDVMRVLKDLVVNGTTVIMVTHHMGEAAEADRLWLLDDGILLADGGPDLVFSRPELLRQLGLALPPAAELAERLAARGVNTTPGIVKIEDMVRFLCHVLK